MNCVVEIVWQNLLTMVFLQLIQLILLSDAKHLNFSEYFIGKIFISYKKIPFT